MVALELTTGKVQAITAKAVILCTGGCGRVFRFTTNAAIKTGDGMALAYRAGAPLKDMEFVQYHPTGLPFTGILITEAARAEGGYLLNKDGYRYLQDYNLGTPQPKPVLRSMELGPRDRLSQAFVQEQEKGRTIEGPYGAVVNLDLRHLGEKTINTKLPFVRELCLKYENIDPITQLIPVRPVVHYMMGGVHTDLNGATPLKGLYAAGEVACVSINGANRLGSNSLPELLVFGARAGRAAAAYAAEQKSPGRHVLAQALDEHTRLQEQFLQKSGGRERIAIASRGDAEDHGAVRWYLSLGRIAVRSGRQASRTPGTVPGHSPGRSWPSFQHGADFRTGAIVHARGCRDDGAMRHGANRVARSAPADGLSGSKRREVSGALAGVPRRGRTAPSGVRAGDHYSLAAGRAGLRKVNGV